MSEHEAKEPGLPVSRPPRFSNGVLLFCVLVLAAIVLYQNWPGRARQRQAPRHATTSPGQGAAAFTNHNTRAPEAGASRGCRQGPTGHRRGGEAAKPKESAPPEPTRAGEGSVAKAPPPTAPLDDKIATRSPAVPARPAEPAPPPTPQVSGRSSDELATIRLFAAASPSVVHITTHTLERDFFSLDVTEIPQGTGSGFVWDPAGHVVTNYHVIEEASGAQVALADHSTWPANLVGVAPDKDLAVLKINAPADRLRPIPVGTSHDLQVGQTSLAIGNPFGLTRRSQPA